MMRKISVNYIMSQLLKPNPNFQRERADQHHQGWPSQSITFMLLWLFFLSPAVFLPPLIYIFIRVDHALTSFNILFASGELRANQQRRWLRRLTLAGEKHAEGALWFGRVDRNFTSLTHCHPPPPQTPPVLPALAASGSSLQHQKRQSLMLSLVFSNKIKMDSSCSLK